MNSLLDVEREKKRQQSERKRNRKIAAEKGREGGKEREIENQREIVLNK